MQTNIPLRPFQKGLLFSLLLLLLFNSCQKEESFDLDSKIQPQASLLGESRLYFNRHMQGQRLQAMPNNPRHRAGKTPIWEQAEAVQLSVGAGFKVPLSYLEEISLLIGPNKEQVPLSSLSYLLMYKNRSGQWQSEVVTLVPDADNWAHRHEAGRSFSGIVIVEDWWGRPIKTFRKVSKGKFIRLAPPVLGSTISGKKGETPQFRKPDVQCSVMVTTNQYNMMEVEYICPEGGIIEEPEDWPGWEPNHDNYEEGLPGGRGSGRRNDNPPNQLENVDYYLPGYDDPKINNIHKYINCFGAVNSPNSNYSLSVFVQEPDYGINSSSGFVNGVGHACVGITKDNITQIIGFYPAGGSLSQITNQNVLGILRDNGTGNFNYTISAHFPIDQMKFDEVIKFLKDFNGSSYTYNLYTRNCTNFVYEIANQAGINLPFTDAPGPTERSPGQLGKDLRLQKNIIDNIYDRSGFAPQSNGPCYD